MVMVVVLFVCRYAANPTDRQQKKKRIKILSLSKRMLRKERGLSIRRGRFLVPQKGYKYRVVIDGVRNEEKAGNFGLSVNRCVVRNRTGDQFWTEQGVR